MERCCWEFHKEPKHEHDEENFLNFETKPDTACVCTARLYDHILHAEGLRIHQEVHRQQTEKHDNGRCKGVDEELLSGVLSVLTTPLENHEEHWNKCQFPEDVEHEHVKSDENTNQCTTEHEHQWEVGCTCFLVPCCNDGNWHQQRCQPNHWEGESVNTDSPCDIELFNPNIGLLEFKRIEGDVVPSNITDLTQEHQRSNSKHCQRYDESSHSNRSVKLCTRCWVETRGQNQQEDARKNR